MGKNYIIVASCDPYHAKFHWHGQRVLKYDGPTPVEWVAGEFDTEEEAKSALYAWCKEESMDMIEWDDEFVAERVSEYVHEGLFGAAKEMLDEYIENGEGLYYNGEKKLDRDGWCYSFDTMSYSVESGDYGEQ